MDDLPRDVTEWSCRNVRLWLQCKGFGHSIMNRFFSEGIDGDALTLLLPKDLDTLLHDFDDDHKAEITYHLKKLLNTNYILHSLRRSPPRSRGRSSKISTVTTGGAICPAPTTYLPFSHAGQSTAEMRTLHKIVWVLQHQTKPLPCDEIRLCLPGKKKAQVHEIDFLLSEYQSRGYTKCTVMNSEKECSLRRGAFPNEFWDKQWKKTYTNTENDTDGTSESDTIHTNDDVVENDYMLFTLPTISNITRSSLENRATNHGYAASPAVNAVEDRQFAQRSHSLPFNNNQSKRVNTKRDQIKTRASGGNKARYDRNRYARYSKENEHDTCNQGKRWNDTDLELMWSLHQKGYSNKQIAEHFHRTECGVMVQIDQRHKDLRANKEMKEIVGLRKKRIDEYVKRNRSQSVESSTDASSDDEPIINMFTRKRLR